MIDLRGLASLAAEHAEDLDHAVDPFRIGDRRFDTDSEPVVMGIVNLSTDSWYHSSISFSVDDAVRRGRVLAAQGAHVVDVGAESVVDTAERVGVQRQVDQLVPVVEGLVAADVPVSVESYHPTVVEACLAAGASVLNLTGSTDDDAMFGLAAEHGASVVLCHIVGDHARDLADPAERRVAADPFPEMREQFARRLEAARAAGVDSVAIDPGVGFGFSWLPDPRDRSRYQAAVQLQSFRLRGLGAPICHALPAALHLFGDEYRTAEGFFTVLASLGGTGIFRTHEVPRIVAVLSALQAFDAQLPAGP